MPAYRCGAREGGKRMVVTIIRDAAHPTPLPGALAANVKQPARGPAASQHGSSTPRPVWRRGLPKSSTSLTTHPRFDTPDGISACERFEFWRTWYSQAVDLPMRLHPAGPLPAAFPASADVLSAGDLDIVDLRCGPACRRWNRQATEPMDRLRLVPLAASPDGVGYWHGREVSLRRGAAVPSGRTTGWWLAPAGLRGMQGNLRARRSRCATPSWAG